jgi:hypothetical protein
MGASDAAWAYRGRHPGSALGRGLIGLFGAARQEDPDDAHADARDSHGEGHIGDVCERPSRA